MATQFQEAISMHTSIHQLVQSYFHMSFSVCSWEENEKV